jgi:5-epi-alpha-selinene synthase
MSGQRRHVGAKRRLSEDMHIVRHFNWRGLELWLRCRHFAMFSNGPTIHDPIQRQIQRLEIPSNWCSNYNPHAAAAHTATRQLALKTGVMTTRASARFDRQNFAHLVALAYPRAKAPELTLINDFCAYLFFNDDQAEEDAAFGKNPERLRAWLDAHVLALRTGTISNERDPLNAFLVDIRTRLMKHTAPSWLERFAFDVEQYLMQGTYVGALHWTAQTVPTVEAYHNQRLYDSALFPAQDLIELSEGITLDARTIESKAVVTLRCACNHVVAYTNDLFSYAKEVVRFESPNNLVHVAMVNEGLSTEGAAARVVDVIHRELARFVETARQLALASRPDPQLDRYVRGMQSWMRGNLLWSLETGRYAVGTAPSSPTSAGASAASSASRLGEFGAGWR